MSRISKLTLLFLLITSYKIFHDFGTLQRIKRSCGSRDMERVYLYQYAIHSLGLLVHLLGFVFSFPRIGIIRSLNLTPIVWKIPKELIRKWKSKKDIQHNDIRHTMLKIEQYDPQKNLGELRYSGMVNNSCSTSDICHVT
jgi:hypothetical protein